MKWKKALKIWWSVILMAACLGGCTESQFEPQPPQWAIEANCCAMVSGVEVQGTLCHTIEGISSFTVISPEEIEGMQVQYRNGTYTVSFEGIVQSDMKSVMDESVFGRLFAALDGGAQAQMEWENQQWSGELSKGEGILVKTDEMGEISALEVPVWQLTATFTHEDTATSDEPL